MFGPLTAPHYFVERVLSLKFHIYDIYDKRGFSRISIHRVGDDPTRDTVLGQAYDELYLSFNWTGVKEI